jgi:hypothetical protein
MVNNKRTTQINERFNKLLTGMHTITHFRIVAFLLRDVHCVSAGRARRSLMARRGGIVYNPLSRLTGLE